MGTFIDGDLARNFDRAPSADQKDALDGASPALDSGNPVAGADNLTSTSVQDFTTSGTWTKPASGTMVLIQCWGAGGGGAAPSTWNAGGGGGGGYNERWMKFSDISGNQTVTIGAGGSGASRPGGDGGDTTFGSYVTAYGGGGGGSQSLVGTGGGGGGTLSAGETGGDDTTVPGDGGRPNGGIPQGAGVDQGRDSAFGGGCGGDNNNVVGAFAHFGGGGGGCEGNPGNGAGGNSVYGGGGGGCGSGTAGGTSVYGGNGGAGGSPGTAGTQPGGGGGGGSSFTNGGTGGAGMVRVTVW